MNPFLDFSPVTLSYVAALRGIKPRQPGAGFAYAEIAGTDPDRLVCLAASNPEGKFYALMAHADGKAEGEKQAQARGVSNVTFLQGRIQDVLAAANRGQSPIPALNYICIDERSDALPPSERTALFGLAEQLLIPGGLFGYGYRAYNRDDDALRLLVNAFAPEMDAAQAQEFLQEIRKIGPYYFGGHPRAAASLERAIASGVPDQFFADYEGADVQSGSLNALLALAPRGFTYAGDADIGMNYIERAAPVSAHQIILEGRTNPFYEVIKDFALNRQQRCDIWTRQPAVNSDSLPELFGSFVYGITLARADVPKQIKSENGTIDLNTPLYTKLIDLMTLTPLSIGDYLAHPDGKNQTPSDVVGAILVLVGCGLARPMRGHYHSNVANIEWPHLAGSFNLYLDKTTVTGARVWLASPMAGSAVAISPRDALVMQALNRAGLANSVSALLPELERLAKDPASAARVMDTATPTAETATAMIKDTVEQSIVQWYAYGLLAAA